MTIKCQHCGSVNQERWEKVDGETSLVNFKNCDECEKDLVNKQETTTTKMNEIFKDVFNNYNIQEIFDRFDEKFGHCFNVGVVPNDKTKEKLKQFIQEELTEALRRVLPTKFENRKMGDFTAGWNDAIEQIENQAKELYNITL